MATVDAGAGVAALVTGASRGIGRVVALQLADLGFAIGVNYRASADAADEVVQAIRSNGGHAVPLPADMAVAAEATDLVAWAERELGPLHILINNAGVTRDRLLLQMTEQEWEATWLTDLVGARVASHAALASMKSRRAGRIVNVGSVVAATGNAGQANYAAAKAGVLGLTRELALKGARFGVTVNCVVPGYIMTDATAHLTREQHDAWLRRIPMQRLATPDEVAGMIVFLTGDAASYITGQCIAVDGGLLAAAGAGLAS